MTSLCDLRRFFKYGLASTILRDFEVVCYPILAGKMQESCASGVTANASLANSQVAFKEGKDRSSKDIAV